MFVIADVEEAAGEEDPEPGVGHVGVETHEEGVDVAGGGGEDEDQGGEPVEEEGGDGGFFVAGRGEVGGLVEGVEMGWAAVVGGMAMVVYCWPGPEEFGEGRAVFCTPECRKREDSLFCDFLLDYIYKLAKV